MLSGEQSPTRGFFKSRSSVWAPLPTKRDLRATSIRSTWRARARRESRRGWSINIGATHGSITRRFAISGSCIGSVEGFLVRGRFSYGRDKRSIGKDFHRRDYAPPVPSAPADRRVRGNCGRRDVLPMVCERDGGQDARGAGAGGYGGLLQPGRDGETDSAVLAGAGEHGDLHARARRSRVRDAGDSRGCAEEQGGTSARGGTSRNRGAVRPLQAHRRV